MKNTLPKSVRLLIQAGVFALPFWLVVIVAAQEPNAPKSTNVNSLSQQFANAYGRDWEQPSSVDPVVLEPGRIVESEFQGIEGTQPFTESALPMIVENEAGPSRLHQADSQFPETHLSRNSPEALSSTQIGDVWWNNAVAQPFDPEHMTESVDINSLLFAALKNSQQIQFLSKDPLIQELEIVEAESEFDPEAFARTVYDDRVDPVGNSLTTGGAPFLKDNIWSGEAGLRKRLYSGGELELEQSLGFQNSNSRFFVPQDQGTATLSLNYNQPLLRGAGQQYNRSQILLAQQTTDLAWDTFSGKLQDELLAVVEAYWDLHFRRAVFLQKQRNVQRGQAILKKIEGRAELDSLPSQIARARSEVQSRRTELANTFRDVRNAETEIRRLISDPNWLDKESIEMLPSEAPVAYGSELILKNVVFEAIQNRPEIRAAVQKAKLATLQTDILTNELLPQLTLLFSSYVSALEGDSGIERAWQQQFSADPGVSIGLEFEFPYKNRGARSRHTRSKIQLSKVHHEIQQTTQNVIAESQIGFRRVISARETLTAAESAVSAAKVDLNQNHRRWQNFALIEGDITEGQTPTLVLDQLLDSQQRLADAEFTYSQALIELKVAEVSLKRATGTLLLAEEIQINKVNAGDQPAIELNRGAGPNFHGAIESPIESSSFDPSVVGQNQIRYHDGQ
jgi:outer membrane protein TolC